MQKKHVKYLVALAVSVISALPTFALEKSAQAATRILSISQEQVSKVWDSNDLRLSTRAASEPTFSVYSGKDGKGFAIVAGERIIGYSPDGEISLPEGLPEAMRNYLLSIDEELRSASARPIAKSPGNVVVELETAKWAQRDPYNRMCPTKNGSRCLTGCIPTAFAIIMQYHKWPIHGTGKVYNPTTGDPVDISAHTYNWDEMLMEYSSGNYTDAQANEVAALMMHLGYAYMVDYSPSNTGGNHNSSTLANKFGYVDVGKTQRWQVGDTEWVRLMKESLDNGCPIPYAATNTGTGDSKHIFVVDGYTENDYYHFNWGWGGNGNGYYLLASMTPSTGDNYSKADSHQAYFNLRPNRVPESYTVSVSATEGGTATVDGKSSVTVEEGSNITLVAVADEGYSFVNWTLAGNEISTSSTVTVTVDASAEYVANFEKRATPFELAVSEAEYATLYLDYNALIPEGAEVYTANAIDGNRLMMQQLNDVIPANTGVIVRARQGTYTFAISGDVVEAIGNNLLCGSVEDAYITPKKNQKFYVLSSKGGVVGMYEDELSGGVFKNNANKAYLLLSPNIGIYDEVVDTQNPGVQLGNSYYFDFSGTTAIENVVGKVEENRYYDFSGRRIDNPTRGMYIVNGKMVMIK